MKVNKYSSNLSKVIEILRDVDKKTKEKDDKRNDEKVYKTGEKTKLTKGGNNDCTSNKKEK